MPAMDSHLVNPDGLSASILGVSISFPVVCGIVVAIRLRIRSSAKCLGCDDWLICAALLVDLLQNAVVASCVLLGIGVPDDRKASEVAASKVRKLVFAWHLLYIFTWVLVKASVCAALLRLTSYQRRRFVMVFLMGLAIATAIVFLVGLLIQCSPIHATWTGGQEFCHNEATLAIAFYLLSAVSIITDFVVALLSVIILGHIKIRTLVKVFVGVVLSLGILASICTAVRLPYLQSYSLAVNNIEIIVLLSILETNIAVITASLPMLCKLLGSPLRKAAGVGAADPVLSANTADRDIEAGPASARDAEAEDFVAADETVSTPKPSHGPCVNAATIKDQGHRLERSSYRSSSSTLVLSPSILSSDISPGASPSLRSKGNG